MYDTTMQEYAPSINFANLGFTESELARACVDLEQLPTIYNENPIVEVSSQQTTLGSTSLYDSSRDVTNSAAFWSIHTVAAFTCSDNNDDGAIYALSYANRIHVYRNSIPQTFGSSPNELPGISICLLHEIVHSFRYRPSDCLDSVHDFAGLMSITLDNSSDYFLRLPHIKSIQQSILPVTIVKDDSLF